MKRITKLFIVAITIIATMGLMVGCGSSNKNDYSKMEQTLKDDGWEISHVKDDINGGDVKDEFMAIKGEDSIHFEREDEERYNYGKS